MSINVPIGIQVEDILIEMERTMLKTLLQKTSEWRKTDKTKSWKEQILRDLFNFFLNAIHICKNDGRIHSKQNP